MSRQVLLKSKNDVLTPHASPPRAHTQTASRWAYEGTSGAYRIIRQPEVARRTGLSRSSIYQRIKEGRFPTPVALGERAVGWLESEIDSWIAECIDASRPPS